MHVRIINEDMRKWNVGNSFWGCLQTVLPEAYSQIAYGNLYIATFLWFSRVAVRVLVRVNVRVIVGGRVSEGLG